MIYYDRLLINEESNETIDDMLTNFIILGNTLEKALKDIVLDCCCSLKVSEEIK